VVGEERDSSWEGCARRDSLRESLGGPSSLFLTCLSFSALFRVYLVLARWVLLLDHWFSPFLPRSFPFLGCSKVNDICGHAPEVISPHSKELCCKPCFSGGLSWLGKFSRALIQGQPSLGLRSLTRPSLRGWCRRSYAGPGASIGTLLPEWCK